MNSLKRGAIKTVIVLGVNYVVENISRITGKDSDKLKRNIIEN